MATTAAAFMKEDLAKPLESTSEPPPLFDGTTRLYISLSCPFAQRVWILRNYKGLQDKIKLVPINLYNRPAWYKEKVYPENKVPALEYNNQVIGESLDLLKYIGSNFEGPALLPNDPAKQEFAEELFTYTDTLNKIVFTSFKAEDPAKEASVAFDHLEAALSKFDDGPFFLGQFSLVDIAYVPFIERFEVFFKAQYNYDITAGRPKLAEWIKELNKIEAYTVTKTDPEELVKFYKDRFVGLQDKIKLVPINLADRPAWYKEKVYPTNRVPALELNKVIGVIGETLNLLKYTNTNFEGSLLLPNDPAKQELAEELLAYSGTLNQTVFSSFKGEDPVKESGAAIDHLETALGKFNDGPYFLGQFSLGLMYMGDLSGGHCLRSIRREHEILIQDEWDYDIKVGRPKLAEWLKELNTMEAYIATKLDPEEFLNVWRSRFRSQ